MCVKKPSPECVHQETGFAVLKQIATQRCRSEQIDEFIVKREACEETYEEKCTQINQKPLPLIR